MLGAPLCEASRHTGRAARLLAWHPPVPYVVRLRGRAVARLPRDDHAAGSPRVAVRVLERKAPSVRPLHVHDVYRNTCTSDSERRTAPKTPSPYLRRRRPKRAQSTAAMNLFSPAPTGCRTVYAARPACFADRGVTLFLTVRAGCMACRTGLGVALRTVLRTTLRPNPISSVPVPPGRRSTRTMSGQMAGALPRPGSRPRPAALPRI